MDRAEGITPMQAAAYVAVFIAIDLAFTLVPTSWRSPPRPLQRPLASSA